MASFSAADVSTPESALETANELTQFVSDITSRIEASIGGTIRDLSVEVIGREVVVAGVVSSYYVKQSVTHAVLPTLREHTLTNAVRVVSTR